MRQKPQTIEQKINEFRILQKEMRRLFWKMRDLGLVDPEDFANTSFMEFDHDLIDIYTRMVTQQGLSIQLQLFSNEEEASSGASSGGD